MPRINGVFLKAVATDCQGGINITLSGSTNLGSMTIRIAGNPSPAISGRRDGSSCSRECLGLVPIHALAKRIDRFSKIA
jgi:hypothetical protein